MPGRFRSPRGRVRFCCLIGLLLFLVLVLALASAPAVQAQPVRQLRVVTAGSCPSGAEVTKELQRLFPSIDVTTGADAGFPDAAVLEEQSGGFWVTLAGFRRYFDEPGQRCAERAQMAAVFIAIALDPPRFPEPLGEPPAPPPPPTSEPLAPRHLELEVGPTLSLAPGAGTRAVPVAAGAGVRGHWGRTVSLTFGAGVATAPLRFQQSDARAVWLPFELGARVTHVGAAARWDGGAELSLVVAPVHFEGVGLSPSWSSWRAELGARGAAFARLWVADRVGIFASFHGLLWPRPYTLRVSGLGQVGETPGFWLGAQLGVAIRIF